MSHLQADRLVLAALGEAPLDEPEAGHVDSCDACSLELESLRVVAAVGRRTAEVSALPAPPPRVWQAISDELSLGEPPAAIVPAVVPAVHARRRPRWLMPALAAAAAAVLAVVGTVLVYDRAEPQPVSCSAPPVELETLPGTPSTVRGTACVAAVPDRTLRVEADGMPASSDAVYTVWLLDPSSLSDPGGIRLQALGNLGDQPESDFPIPGSIDLDQYSVIDISREPTDGDAAHSGDSLLRGQLQ